MADNIKIDSKWVVVKTRGLSEVDKVGLIGAGFSYPKGRIVHQHVLIHPRNETDNPPNNVAGLIALYSKPTDAVYGEISPADMAELESLIASLGLERGGRRKSRKSRKSRKNKSRKSRKNKSRKSRKNKSRK